MSQKVERYEGRKPVYAPEGPASATSSGPLVAIGTVRAPAYYGDVAEALTGGAGPVERRQATPDEMAAARAREVEPSALPRATSIGEQMATDVVSRSARSHIPEAERMQASRQRGGERHAEVLAARRPSPELELPPEESVMPEPKPLDTFEALAEAATEASEAWARRQAAEIAWEIAQEALEAALGEVEAILHPPEALAAVVVATKAPDELAPADGDLVDPPGDEIWRDVPATTPEPEPPATGGGPASADLVRDRVQSEVTTDFRLGPHGTGRPREPEADELTERRRATYRRSKARRYERIRHARGECLARTGGVCLLTVPPQRPGPRGRA